MEVFKPRLSARSSFSIIIIAVFVCLQPSFTCHSISSEFFEMTPHEKMEERKQPKREKSRPEEGVVTSPWRMECCKGWGNGLYSSLCPLHCRNDDQCQKLPISCNHECCY